MERQLKIPKYLFRLADFSSRRMTWLTAIVLVSVVATWSQAYVKLWPNLAPGATGSDTANNPYVVPFPVSNGNGAAVVILPGGAYVGLATSYEGDDVATWMNTLGVTAFVLRYRLGSQGYHHPIEMWDGQRSIRWVRAHAAQYHIDIHRVGIVGFSAGGHLASTVATHYDSGNPAGSSIDNYTGTHDSVDTFSCRPDFQILGYPVITMDSSFTNMQSRVALLGNNPSPALVTLLSNEKQVTDSTPPAFLVQTLDDGVVPVKNSEVYADSLQSKGVAHMLLLYPHGSHGFGLANGKDGAPLYTDVELWPDSAAAWMQRQGYLTPPTALMPQPSKARVDFSGRQAVWDASGRVVDPGFAPVWFGRPGKNPSP